MKNVKQIVHPVLWHKLSYLRDKKTQSHEFRSIVAEISQALAYEATQDLPTMDTKIETPMGVSNSKRISTPPVIVSVMRAGNGMLDALLDTLPFARAGHIGIYRDKFIHNTVEYYFKLPDNVKDEMILLADPLLATGDTMIACIDRLKQYEVGEIRVLTILCSKQGLEQVTAAHPDVTIYTIDIETKLNEKGYLVPGLGDAGDRLYNIKPVQ